MRTITASCSAGGSDSRLRHLLVHFCLALAASSPKTTFGDHLVCCPRINFSRRHNAVQEVLADMVRMSGVSCEREAPLPEAAEAGSIRPADLLLGSGASGKPLAIDLTVAHGWTAAERNNSQQASTKEVSRERWRTFLKKREDAKHKTYDTACGKVGWKFKAMAFGTWGGLGPEASSQLETLVRRAGAWQTGDLRLSQQESLRLGVGVALMREMCVLLEHKNALF